MQIDVCVCVCDVLFRNIYTIIMWKTVSQTKQRLYNYEIRSVTPWWSSKSICFQLDSSLNYLPARGIMHIWTSEHSLSPYSVNQTHCIYTIQPLSHRTQQNRRIASTNAQHFQASLHSLPIAYKNGSPQNPSYSNVKTTRSETT